MKFHKLIVLTVVLLLPMQGLLADNVKGMYQYSVKKVPAKTTSKLKMVAPIRRGVVVANPVANSGSAIASQKLTAPNRKLKIVRPKPRPNLIVSVRYEHDVCPIDESRLRKNTYNARCNLIITVKNIGNAPTDSENGSISIDLVYLNYMNRLQKGVRLINNLGANRQKVIVYDRFKVRNFRKSTSFTVIVDRHKRITETNESDNTAVFQL